MSDPPDLAAIRARHERVTASRIIVPGDGYDAYHDRATLLAYVEWMERRVSDSQACLGSACQRAELAESERDAAVVRATAADAVLVRLEKLLTDVVHWEECDRAPQDDGEHSDDCTRIDECAGECWDAVRCNCGLIEWRALASEARSALVVVAMREPGDGQ